MAPNYSFAQASPCFANHLWYVTGGQGPMTDDWFISRIVFPQMPAQEKTWLGWQEEEEK